MAIVTSPVQVLRRPFESVLDVERETLPGAVLLTAKAKWARRAEREAKHHIERRLVAVPADPGTDSVRGEQYVLDGAASNGSKGLDPRRERRDEVRDRLNPVQTPVAEIIAQAERRHAALALEGAEPERREAAAKRKPRSAPLLLDRDELRLIAQPRRPYRVPTEEISLGMRQSF
jgi:hypothetical protein